MSDETMNLKDPILSFIFGFGQLEMRAAQLFSMFFPSAAGDSALQILGIGAMSVMTIAAAMRHPEWGQAITRIAEESKILGGGEDRVFDLIIDQIVRGMPVEFEEANR